MMAIRQLSAWLPGLAMTILVGTLQIEGADELAYEVRTGTSHEARRVGAVPKMRITPARLLVSNDRISVTGGSSDFNTSCSDFLNSTIKAGSGLMFAESGRQVYIFVTQKHVDRSKMLDQIREACRTQQTTTAEKARVQRVLAEADVKQQQDTAAEAEQQRAEEAEEARRLAEWEKEEAARRAADAALAAKLASDFRDGILSALHAAEEADPFASLRGDFDLSAPDSHQWKTSFRLPDADNCFMRKATPRLPSLGSVWTLACTFRSFHEGTILLQVSGDGYQRIVKSVQTALNLPFQPDEQAANINQVFFSDPSRPRWRLFVGRLNDSTVGISVVAAQLAGAGAIPK